MASYKDFEFEFEMLLLDLQKGTKKVRIVLEQRNRELITDGGCPSGSNATCYQPYEFVKIYYNRNKKTARKREIHNRTNFKRFVYIQILLTHSVLVEVSFVERFGKMEIDSPPISETKHLMCVPGQRLCLCEENTIPGQGTYERQGYIYSMLAGLVQIRQKDKMKILEVKSFGNQTIVPIAGDIVTAKVTVLNQRIAKCLISCVGDVPLNRTYRGLLRKEDGRSTEKDRVDMYKSFRPGDVILARVLPHTELHCYQLSTAENELGVVVAMAAESGLYGVPMIPVSWTEMQCPQSLVKEPRKVAKIVSESAVNIKTEPKE